MLRYFRKILLFLGVLGVIKSQSSLWFVSSQSLEDNIEMCKVKIERAEKLISGLGGEKDRWTQVEYETFLSVYWDFYASLMKTI